MQCAECEQEGHEAVVILVNINGEFPTCKYCYQQEIRLLKEQIMVAENDMQQPMCRRDWNDLSEKVDDWRDELAELENAPAIP